RGGGIGAVGEDHRHSGASQLADDTAADGAGAAGDQSVALGISQGECHGNFLSVSKHATSSPGMASGCGRLWGHAVKTFTSVETRLVRNITMATVLRRSD